MKTLPARRRERIRRGASEEMKKMLLSEMRRHAGLTQKQLAKAIGIKQPTLSGIESQDDMQISTLDRIVRALGGKLDIIATLPTGKVSLSQFARAAR